jgi:hypothetical protein
VELGRQLGDGGEVFDPEIDGQLVGRVCDEVAVVTEDLCRVLDGVGGVEERHLGPELV